VGTVDPTNPTFPTYWTSKWAMYRVFNNYVNNSPPYDGKPPAALVEGQDYELSYGASYYDSAWQGMSGKGAMMEHYEKRCLPIFPMANQYTCSFISLGKTAFFVTYPEDRPKDMPPRCRFDPPNAPIVSQNYTDFAMVKPDAAKTWAQVSGLDPATLPACQLFNPPSNAKPTPTSMPLHASPSLRRLPCSTFRNSLSRLLTNCGGRFKMPVSSSTRPFHPK
jgi:hypothetical protein